jgi:hypothetical protein
LFGTAKPFETSRLTITAKASAIRITAMAASPALFARQLPLGIARAGMLWLQDDSQLKSGRYIRSPPCRRYPNARRQPYGLNPMQTKQTLYITKFFYKGRLRELVVNDRFTFPDVQACLAAGIDRNSRNGRLDYPSIERGFPHYGHDRP